MFGNEVIYQIFVRNYSLEGTFNAVERDLVRIHDLGVDIIYLTPIHEIGVLNRKGTYGSPYAIKDYFSISKDLGSKEDFISLVNAIHQKGMRIILDMVFNHTSPDNVLVDTHPEYYFYKNGKRGNRVGDWSDIVDLDTSREDTQLYLLDVLKYWVSLGVDGFRFDVASMIPLSFFQRARKELGNDIIFVGESIDYDFARYLKEQGEITTSDDDMFPTFDALYNYSWFKHLKAFLKGEEDLSVLVDALNDDESLLFNKGLRLNCLENHDQERIASLPSINLNSLVDFVSYIKGLLFIYMGQEYGNTHLPQLFEKDPVKWEKNDDALTMYKNAILEKKIDINVKNIRQLFRKVNDNTIEVIKLLDGRVIDNKQFKLK
ncbi:MAG: alpha-amylase [Bacilli bacterium]|nr:alpha-amylase [Bacilli bacterium]